MPSFNKKTQVVSFHLLFVHLYFMVFLLISITKFPIASHCCHEEDRNALLNFKSSLNDSSNRLSSWKEGSQHEDSCCNWHGIRCSNHSFRVVSINLRNEDVEIYLNQFDSSSSDVLDPPSTSLIGKFSASLLKVTHLEYLDLAFNNFQQSQIPRQFSDLTRLTHLDLSYSNFSTSISTQFTNLSSIKYLDLSCRRKYYATSCFQISSTKWVTHLVNLQVLRMAGIELNSSFPSQMANLTSLSIFELSHSNIRGSVPYLPQLEELDVSDNHDLHVDLPRMFKQQWPKLQKLWISSTVLNRPIPSSISNAPLLVSLSASSCSIQGSLPSSIYNLSQLQYLDLSGNSITGFIHPSFSNLESLYYLDLSSNNFQGSIPKSMCENLSFQILRLDYNNITGTVPSCITKLQNLKVFSAARNSIEGNVSLFSLSENLTTLDMRFNSQLNLDMRFNLDQYSSLYPKLNLKYLWLGSCNFKGLFPISFCNLTNLVELDVSQNRLTGTIPSCLSQLRYLRRIYVTENKLHGPVPLPPPGIEVFDLSNNKLSGEISIEVGKRLFNASAISLAGNELSGSIPFTLCPTVPSFTSTQFIDLSGNKLSGTIPSNIGYCRNLGTLKLGNNNLTGKVPDELKLAKNIRFLQLNNNHLDGNPTNLASEFRKLEFLNLANNNFEGSIPKTLGSLKHLRFLSLRSNNFNGSIPKEIIHLQDLQLIDLAINKFSGNLPNKCGNLRGLIMTKYLVDLNYGDVQLDVATKGIMIQIKKLNNYSSTIDLSCNNLDGNIPKEIGLLTLLSSLNLSNNYFSGDIPESIADLSGLESLDLNSNKLSGHIPQSLTNIDSLAVLDLSFNKLSGMIPRGPHFDTLSLDGSAFTGNELLCGFPTEKICKGDRNTGTSYVSPVIEVDGVDRDDAMEKFLLYAIVVLGFVVGFWGLFFVLLLRKEKWWFPYWRSIDFIAVRITNFIQNQNERL